MNCNFEWWAPYLHAPPSTKVSSVRQKCSLSAHHEGDHRSLTNVTYPQNHQHEKQHD